MIMDVMNEGESMEAKRHKNNLIDFHIHEEEDSEQLVNR